LRAGGDLEGALGPYKDTVERHLAESDHHAAEVVFNNWFDILVELDHPADHERWYEAKLARARIASIRGALSEAETLVGEVLPVANAQNWIDLAVECHLLQALLSLNQARFPESLERTSEFETLVPPTERPAQRALCFWYRARAQASLGKLTDALEAFKEAERFFLLTDNVVRAAHCLLGQARIACQQGAHGEAVKLAEGARFDLERAGSRVGVADALNDLGELARLVGDFPAAEAHYRQARRRYEQVGSPHIIYAELNLAAVLLARKFFLEAKVFSEKVLEVARRQGRRLHMTVAHVFLLSTSAQDHDWDSWDAHLRQVRALIKQTKVVDIDIAHHLRAAADLAATAGQQGRASEVFGLSLEQWNAMDREDEVIATAERMKALEIEKK
jgi:tetratricopeptide (TPR) repeat protein